MIRILRYKSEQIYNRPDLYRILLDRLNNLNDDEGFSVGSGLVLDLRLKRKFIAWIAWHAGTPIGWGTLTPRRDDTNLQASIYVSPDFRKLGVASKMIKKMKNWAHGYAYIKAQPWDAKGRKFYRKHSIGYCIFLDYNCNDWRKIRRTGSYSSKIPKAAKEAYNKQKCIVEYSNNK